MARAAVKPERVSVAELVERLGAMHRVGVPSAVVFDGDGTLWSGDVAEDVFHHAVKHGLLRDEPRANLARVARAHGIDAAGSSNEIVGRLWDEYARGAFPERTVYEVMAWCFAGFGLSELRELTREVFELTGLDGRLRRSLAPVLELVRYEGVRVCVVSASPRFIVEMAAALWGIPDCDIAASTTRLEAERVLPSLAGPIPYAETKPHHARELIGDARWLASFGDSAFDVDMLRAAELGVAVGDKPSLLDRLAELPGVVVLDG